MPLAVPAFFGSVVLLIILFFVFPWPRTKPGSPNFGMTFSRAYAQEDLGLDADIVLKEALDDLKIRRFRIPAYWNRLEREPGVWTFDELDRELSEINKRNGKVVLAIGQKLPRWPECWIPKWAEELKGAEREAAVLNYIETVMRYYNNHPTIVGWQIENEARFAYGICPDADHQLLRNEMRLAARLEVENNPGQIPRPISTTESGELSTWTTFWRDVNLVGVSIYRVVKNPTIGVWHYWFLPPTFYERKAGLLRRLGLQGVYVSEFQMEPWNNKPLSETSLEEQFETFDLAQMTANFKYAKELGMAPIDFWGVEWWYWIKEKQAHPEFWEMAKAFWSNKKE